MSVLTALQSASIRLLGKKPSSFFSVTTAFEVAMANLAIEAAVAIAKAHDWQVLTKLATATGDGTATEFSLPDDFDRMVKKGEVHSSTWQLARYQQARDVDEWLDLQTFLASGAPGYWMLLGGKFNILPAMATGETAKYYYVSKYITTSGDKAAFTADDDAFVLPERLLTLGVIWRFRSQERLEYSEDMANYETALAEEISRDRGQRIIIEGRQTVPGNVSLAYPGSLG